MHPRDEKIQELKKQKYKIENEIHELEYTSKKETEENFLGKFFFIKDEYEESYVYFHSLECIYVVESGTPDWVAVVKYLNITDVPRYFHRDREWVEVTMTEFAVAAGKVLELAEEVNKAALGV